MKYKNFKPKLHRFIGQVGFRPNLGSFSNVAKVAQKVESDFEEWRAQKSNDIILYSPSERRGLKMTSDSITYVSEKSEDINELKKYINNIFTKYVKDFSVEEIRRVGFRITQILESKFELQDLVDLIYGKFYADHNKVARISTEIPKDVVFVLDGFKNSFSNHVQIGPVKKEEAIKYFNSTFDVETNVSSEGNLFVDVDVFKNEGLNTKNVLDNLDKAIEENLRISKEYLSYLDK